MSAIFISHSSSDNEVAAAIRERLHALGHSSIFLDFDPTCGIPAGRSWERELYHRLQACRGVIVLCSEHSMSSRWCFAEITHARSLGKHIFPVRVDDADIDPVLMDRQVVDYRSDPEDAFTRLVRGLELAGIDAADPMDWDATRRPPYPGLLAFQEDDAPIFFGRDGAVGDGLDLVNRAQRYAGSGLALILGASGSGKSSVVRAGMLPRLRRNPARWRVVGPMRPGERPFDRLAEGLLAAAGDAGLEIEESPLGEALETAPVDEAVAVLVRAVDAVCGRDAGGADNECSVLLVVDQLEELLGSDRSEEIECFLDLLCATIANGAPIVVLGTLRSDFLAELQNDAKLGAVERYSMSLGPLEPDDLRQIIEGPAKLAGLTLESGLADAMLRDAGAEDALPLLAFTLRSLYDRDGQNGELTLASYRSMGGLAGSVGTAADALMETLRPTAEERTALRRTFIRMVRADSGHLARQPVHWSTIPEAAHRGLSLFEDPGRLLVSRGDGRARAVEVRHEALFRTWQTLVRWLRESRELRRIRDSLMRAAEEWRAAAAEERGGMLVHRAGRLEEAERLAAAGELELGELGQAYFTACIAERDRQVAEAERRQRKELEDARRLAEESARRQRVESQRARIAQIFAVAISLALVATVYLFVTASRQAKILRSRHLAELASQALTSNHEQAKLLAIEASLASPTAEAEHALHAVLAHQGQSIGRLAGHREPVGLVTWSPDGARLLSASDDGTARVWSGSGWTVPLELVGHAQKVVHAAWSPRGTRVATASLDNTARVWNAAQGRQSALLAGHAGPVQVVAWSPDGDRLATAGADGTVRLWNPEIGSEVARLEGLPGIVDLAAWSHDGEQLAIAGAHYIPSDEGDFGVRIWHPATGDVRQILEGHTARLASIHWSPDDRHLLSGSQDGSARVWPLDRAGDALVLAPHGDWVTRAAWSPDGSRVATASRDGSTRLWQPFASGGPRLLAAWRGSSEAFDVAWSPDGTRLASAFGGGVGRVWDARTRELIAELTGHQAGLLSLAWNPDGVHLATGSRDATARVWDLRAGVEMPTLEDADDPIQVAAWSPDGTRVLSGGRLGGVHVWDAARSHETAHFAGADAPLVKVAWSGDGRRILGVDQNGTALVWSTTTGSTIARVEADPRGVLAAAWHPDGIHVATSGLTPTVQVWSSSEERVVARLAGHESWVRDVAWRPDGTLLASAGIDGTVRVWDPWSADGERAEPIVLRAAATVAWRTAWSPDGTWLAAIGSDRSVRVWRCCEGSMRQIGRHDDWIWDLAWSDDGQHLATASKDGTIRIFSPSGGAGRVLRGHAGSVRSVHWSSGGSRLLSAGDDGTARIWQADGTPVGMLITEGGPLADIAPSSDGQRVLTVDREGRLRVFFAGIGALKAAACRRTVRNLTLREWQAFFDGACRPTCPIADALGCR